ncbi:MAG: hypothetical protein MUC36_23390 [Planctomycetes bacterium]|jgi:hypothetical protein|nr:hypothetical protein [Planctomycetota bacterium]
MTSPARKIAIVSLLALVAGGAFLLLTTPGRKLQFMIGGGLVNLGYRMQDHLEDFDFAHHEVTPTQVWDEMLEQNRLAAGVRQSFPRTPRHPLVAMVVCMDARLDTNELTGDTRKYYYVIRTAGSVLETKEAEMLELAVHNGVKLIVLTTHSDCAAERAAADPVQRERFPSLARAVAERGMRMRELLERPALAQRIAEGQLLVKHIDIDTMTEKMRPQ